MFLGMTSVELLIISFFVITMINCAITYVFCSKCLTIFEEEKALNKAVKKLRMYDQYVLSKINLIIGVFYFVYVYFILMEMMGSNSYIFFFSCIFSFGLTLVTTFVSRLCYCYTGNVLLETKLNEFECFLVNLKSLILLYLPFVVISALVPSVYMLDIDYYWRNVLFVVGLTIVLTLWIVLAPVATILFSRAKKVKRNTLLRHRLEQMFNAHDIKKYEFYLWDTSRSKESNALVVGVTKNHLLISSSLIESVTLPELETIILHEIGHIKNRHLSKKMIGKLFIVISMLFMILLPYWFSLNQFYKIVIYILACIVFFLEVVASIAVERRYEMEADSYANCYSDHGLFVSAIKKVVKYEDEEFNLFDELFQSHPSLKNRIKNDRK